MEPSEPQNGEPKASHSSKTVSEDPIHALANLSLGQFYSFYAFWLLLFVIVVFEFVIFLLFLKKGEFFLREPCTT